MISCHSLGAERRGFIFTQRPWNLMRIDMSSVVVKVETKNDWSDQINSHNQQQDTHSDRTSQDHEVRECQDQRSHQEHLESRTKVHQTWCVSQRQMYHCTDSGAFQPPLCHFLDWHKPEPFDHNVTNLFAVETITICPMYTRRCQVLYGGIDNHFIRGSHVINSTRSIEWTNVVDEFHNQITETLTSLIFKPQSWLYTRLLIMSQAFLSFERSYQIVHKPS